MEKIKFVTDSASDIPDADLARLNIDMLKFPITVDGVGFFERDDFTFHEYYQVLEKAKEIPVTSRINEDTFIKSYEKAHALGFDHVVVVTINAGGSSTFTSANMARDMFYEQAPGAKDEITINILDSATYSLGYGYPIIKAAEMAEENGDIDAVIAYLTDWFKRVEIYAGCYTLKYAQKSGRIHFATAFVGELLGMRPIIALIRNTTTTVEKVRGDHKIAATLLKRYRDAKLDPDEPVVIIHGENIDAAKELQAMFKKEFKREPPIYYAGAAIVTNIGPKVLAIVYKNEDKE